MKQTYIAYIIVGVVIAGAAGFFGGMKYQESKTPVFGMRTFGNGQRQIQNGGTRENTMMNGQNPMGFNRPVTGTITSIDGKTITVKEQDGSSKIVVLSDTTTYSKSQEAKKDDLSVNTIVSVFGTANSDGSTTATSIAINPIERFKLDTTQK